ncbi:MAG: hypothetical protein QM686_21405, partial [Herbaspirillum sp.]
MQSSNMPSRAGISSGLPPGFIITGSGALRLEFEWSRPDRAPSFQPCPSLSKALSAMSAQLIDGNLLSQQLRA